MNTTTSMYHSSLRAKAFAKKVNEELHGRIIPHLNREIDCGYSFRTLQQVGKSTKLLNVKRKLRRIESQIRLLPEPRKDVLRYMVHRELNAILSRFEQYLSKSN